MLSEDGVIGLLDVEDLFRLLISSTCGVETPSKNRYETGRGEIARSEACVDDESDTSAVDLMSIRSGVDTSSKKSSKSGRGDIDRSDPVNDGGLVMNGEESVEGMFLLVLVLLDFLDSLLSALRSLLGSTGLLYPSVPYERLGLNMSDKRPSHDPRRRS